MSDELIELKKISKLLALANASALEEALAKYATTNERKRAWVSIDGSRLPEEIGKRSGMKLRTIQDFLKTLVDADLIENKRGAAPKRLLDFVPASWLSLITSETEEKGQDGVNKNE